MASDLERSNPNGVTFPMPDSSERDSLNERSTPEAVHGVPQRAFPEDRFLMAAGRAHELNNLLTIVLGSLEQMRRQPLDERGQQQLERAQWGARQAGRLSRQALSSARHDSDDEPLVDLNEAVGAFVRTMGRGAMGQCAGDGIRLVVETAPGPLPTRLDLGQLELALLNLVRNAADAMPGGDPVVLRTARHRTVGLGDGSTIEVSVSDTGTGMAPETVQRATAAFFTTKGRGRGTGLGLWMVQRFAQESGGKVEIETALSRGTTVRIILPRSEGPEPS